MTARIPEGMTDPDAIDRWLEAQDERAGQRVAVLDDAVMATVARHRPNPDAANNSKTVSAIEDCIAYSELPWWRRWPFAARPPGYVNRHPVGQLHS